MIAPQCSGNFYVTFNCPLELSCLTVRPWQHSVFLKTDIFGHAAVLSALGRYPNLEKSSEDNKRDEAVFSACNP
jgi:hypothetical protein